MTTLVRCPLCGEDKGYTLGTADTYRWWTVCCGACGRQVDECRSNSNTSMIAAKPMSWPAADEVWNQAGALAETLRAKVQAQALQILAMTGEVATAIAAEREASVKGVVEHARMIGRAEGVEAERERWIVKAGAAYTEAHTIFNNPPSETPQEVRDVIEWHLYAMRHDEIEELE